MSDRTFKIQAPLMEGSDIKEWQQQLLQTGRSWNVDFPIKPDGVYGPATRSFSKTVLYGLGFEYTQMDEGITPYLRVMVREPKQRPETVLDRIDSPKRKTFRENLRRKFTESDLAAPVGKIITMTWGWHPGVHDGVDLICGPNAPIFSICDARVIDVRSSGWWGKAPSGNVSLGDGIIQIEALEDDGPIKKGMHFGYGHAEHAAVRNMQKVKAGQRLGSAGLAVAWHVHFMANRGGTMRGVGEFDPRPILEHVLKRVS